MRETSVFFFFVFFFPRRSWRCKQEQTRRGQRALHHRPASPRTTAVLSASTADMGLPVTIKVNFRGNVKRFLAQDLDKLEWESVEAWVSG